MDGPAVLGPQNRHPVLARDDVGHAARLVHRLAEAELADQRVMETAALPQSVQRRRRHQREREVLGVHRGAEDLGLADHLRERRTVDVRHVAVGGVQHVPAVGRRLDVHDERPRRHGAVQVRAACFRPRRARRGGPLVAERHADHAAVPQDRLRAHLGRPERVPRRAVAHDELTQRVSGAGREVLPGAAVGDPGLPAPTRVAADDRRAGGGDHRLPVAELRQRALEVERGAARRRHVAGPAGHQQDAPGLTLGHQLAERTQVVHQAGVGVTGDPDVAAVGERHVERAGLAVREEVGRVFRPRRLLVVTDRLPVDVAAVVARVVALAVVERPAEVGVLLHAAGDRQLGAGVEDKAHRGAVRADQRTRAHLGAAERDRRVVVENPGQCQVLHHVRQRERTPRAAPVHHQLAAATEPRGAQVHVRRRRHHEVVHRGLGQPAFQVPRGTTRNVHRTGPARQQHQRTGRVRLRHAAERVEAGQHVREGRPVHPDPRAVRQPQLERGLAAAHRDVRRVRVPRRVEPLRAAAAREGRRGVRVQVAAQVRCRRPLSPLQRTSGVAAGQERQADLLAAPDQRLNAHLARLEPANLTVRVHPGEALVDPGHPVELGHRAANRRRLPLRLGQHGLVALVDGVEPGRLSCLVRAPGTRLLGFAQEVRDRPAPRDRLVALPVLRRGAGPLAGRRLLVDRLVQEVDQRPAAPSALGRRCLDPIGQTELFETGAVGLDDDGAVRHGAHRLCPGLRRLGAAEGGRDSPLWSEPDQVALVAPARRRGALLRRGLLRGLDGLLGLRLVVDRLHEVLDHVDAGPLPGVVDVQRTGCGRRHQAGLDAGGPVDLRRVRVRRLGGQLGSHRADQLSLHHVGRDVDLSHRIRRDLDGVGLTGQQAAQVRPQRQGPGRRLQLVDRARVQHGPGAVAARQHLQRLLQRGRVERPDVQRRLVLQPGGQLPCLLPLLQRPGGLPLRRRLMPVDRNRLVLRHDRTHRGGQREVGGPRLLVPGAAGEVAAELGGPRVVVDVHRDVQVVQELDGVQ